MAIEHPGWGYPLNSRKAHYFTTGEIISICRKMMYSGPRQDDNHNSPDNCAECKRKQKKLSPVESPK